MSNVSLSALRADNARIVKLLAKATTQEPKSAGHAWVSGDKSNMQDVITFRTEGKNKGSLERFAEANKISTPVYAMLREAAAYGAHSTQGSVKGVLAFQLNKNSLKNLEAKLNALYASRDVDGNGQLDAKEQAKAKKTKNGKALLEGRAKLKETKLGGLRSEHKFSRQVNYVVDLLYSKGSIAGPAHVANIVKGLPKAQGEAVENAYAAVSRYLSSGATGEMSFICQDRRREVTRGLMRIYGASLDTTEKSIAALKLPAGY